MTTMNGNKRFGDGWETIFYEDVIHLPYTTIQFGVGNSNMYYDTSK